MEALASQRGAPVAAVEFDATAMPCTVRLRDGQRGGVTVGRHHSPSGPCGRERDRHRTASGAEIRRRDIIGIVDDFQCGGNQDFGIRARDEHRRRHGQRKRPELALAEEIRGRFTRTPALQEFIETVSDFRRYRFITVRPQPRACAPERVREQDFGVQTGRFRHRLQRRCRSGN